MGRIRSEERRVRWLNRWNQNAERAKPASILQPSIKKFGHGRVVLSVDGNKTELGVHVLVCMAFHGPRPSDRHITAHNDGDPSNNRPENVRWATQKENCSDRVAHGTAPLRGQNPNARTNEAAVAAIRLDRTNSQRRLAEIYGISASQVRNIQKGVSWPSASKIDTSYLKSNTRALRSHLTENDITTIRARAGMQTQASLARQFGTTPSNIGAIQRGKSWR